MLSQFLNPNIRRVVNKSGLTFKIVLPFQLDPDPQDPDPSVVIMDPKPCLDHTSNTVKSTNKYIKYNFTPFIIVRNTHLWLNTHRFKK